jgi:hypothetical protein
LTTYLQEPLIIVPILERVITILSFVFTNDGAESVLELVILHLLVN